MTQNICYLNSMEGGELFRHIKEHGDQAFTERGTDPHNTPPPPPHTHTRSDEKTVKTSQLIILFFCFFLPHDE